MREFFKIMHETCHLVLFLIPPLLKLDVIDRTGCIVLGSSIGIVVAVKSIYGSQASLKQSQ